MAAKPKKFTSKDVMTEAQVQQWMELTADQLKELRNKANFPFIAVTRTKRMYWVEDVVAWMESNRKNIPSEDTLDSFKEAS